MKLQMKLSALNTMLQENLAGIRVVKAFVREPYEEAPDRRRRMICSQNLKISSFFVHFPADLPDRQPGTSGVLYAGSFQILSGALTIGQWQEFSLYLSYVFMPLGQLGIYHLIDGDRRRHPRPAYLKFSTRTTR